MKMQKVVASLFALVLVTAARAQVQFIDVDPGNEGIALGGNWYNSSTNHLIVPGINLYGGLNTTSSWLFDIDLTAGSFTRTLIPAAINGGDVFGVGISRNGANVFGWMDSSGSDPIGDGEGFTAPIDDLGNRTLIGFLPQGAHESRVHDMSANGVAVGVATGGAAFTWTQSSGIQALPTTGGAGARTISSDGNLVAGYFADQGPGTEGAGTWAWDGNQWNSNPLSPLDGLSQVLHGSSDGYYLGGSRNFNATAWIDGVYQEILLDGLALNGEVRAVTDDGFFVGVGLFGSDVRAFVWNSLWDVNEAMTARDYVLWSQGIDIGHDILELNGAVSYGGNLYLTGYGSGAVLRTPAVVPEPGVLALLGTGALSLLLRRRA